MEQGILTLLLVVICRGVYGYVKLPPTRPRNEKMEVKPLPKLRVW